MVCIGGGRIMNRLSASATVGNVAMTYDSFSTRSFPSSLHLHLWNVGGRVGRKSFDHLRLRWRPLVFRSSSYLGLHTLNWQEKKNNSYNISTCNCENTLWSQFALSPFSLLLLSPRYLYVCLRTCRSIWVSFWMLTLLRTKLIKLFCYGSDLS